MAYIMTSGSVSPKTIAPVSKAKQPKLPLKWMQAKRFWLLDYTSLLERGWEFSKDGDNDANKTTAGSGENWP